MKIQKKKKTITWSSKITWIRKKYTPKFFCLCSLIASATSFHNILIIAFSIFNFLVCIWQLIHTSLNKWLMFSTYMCIVWIQVFHFVYDFIVLIQFLMQIKSYDLYLANVVTQNCLCFMIEWILMKLLHPSCHIINMKVSFCF